MISFPSELQPVESLFAALLGLAFGSFLNVCLVRLPQGESIAAPRSHCRHCQHNLAWWENLPLLSWILLAGRCRSCRAWIGLRYPLVELAVGLLWAGCWIKYGPALQAAAGGREVGHAIVVLAGSAGLGWLLIALAALDAEHLWLPDLLTLPGIALGLIAALLQTLLLFRHPPGWLEIAWQRILEILAAAALILAIRLGYWIVRRKEGMGLGDAKLMAMLAAWLGLVGALECFAAAIGCAMLVSLAWLAILAVGRKTGEWAQTPLPLGTFLCLAGLAEIFAPGWLWDFWSRHVMGI